MQHTIGKLLSVLIIGFSLTIILILNLITLSEASGQTDVSETKLQSFDPMIIIIEDGQLQRNGEPFQVKGGNYYPKDYAWDRFWISYTEAITQIETELDLVQSMQGNTIRLFLPYALFNNTPASESYQQHLMDFMHMLDERELVAIVTLFDFYPNVSPSPYSPQDYLTSTQHISSVIHTIGITNPTVLAWDIKNELDRDYLIFDETEVKNWAVNMISFTRQIDPNHLITVGFYGAIAGGTLCYDSTITDTLVYDPAIAAEFAPVVDLVSMHYFLSERCFPEDLQSLQDLVDTPILLEEFGLHTLADPDIPCATYPNDPQCDDPHTEAEQAAYYNALLSVSEANNLAGYLFWTLTDFSYILPNSQQSHYCQGILRNSNVSNCEITTTVDYSKKPAAFGTENHFASYQHYLDLFQGWTDPDTDVAPAGWVDNWQAGGALMRGYNPNALLWSHSPGHIALSKFVSVGTSITGTALSPKLLNVDIEKFPLLAGEVTSYSVRDMTFGSDDILYIGVQREGEITRLLTIPPTMTWPLTFNLDLRDPPLNWTGQHTFHIALELVPVEGQNGYSAAYEFDWIGLQEDIVAGFSATPLSGTIPLTVSFSNDSSGDVYAAMWDFGDGQVSTDTNPTHIYTNSGLYTVSLTIDGPGGVDTLTRSQYITVYEPVAASFTAVPTGGQPPLIVEFTNTSTGDFENCYWSFEEESQNLEVCGPHPITYTYNLIGTFTPTLEITGDGGSDIYSTTIYIFPDQMYSIYLPSVKRP